jgi:septal ring factor EnvC (AmiA/AmiB activator)
MVLAESLSPATYGTIIAAFLAIVSTALTIRNKYPSELVEDINKDRKQLRIELDEEKEKTRKLEAENAAHRLQLQEYELATLRREAHIREQDAKIEQCEKDLKRLEGRSGHS